MSKNLRAIIRTGGLLSDRAVLARGGPAQAIGMSQIKRRRIEELEVGCHPGTRVGDYVPFYFCPRSVMLFVIHCANHPELAYRDGQKPIVHLEADLHRVVDWAGMQGTRWAISLSNAGARYAEFRNQVHQLLELDWTAIAARDFRDPVVKERKQAEFLLHERFPFELVERIGVLSSEVQRVAEEVVAPSPRPPVVETKPSWYF